MVQTEIDAIRALLSSKPRPVGWVERRQRIDEVGSVWPVADDVEVTAVDAAGVPAEWSIAPGSDASRVLMFLHGGGYCSGSILSHRRMVTEAGRAAGMRTLAVGYRLAPEHPFPAALEDALTAWRFVPRARELTRRVSRSAGTARAAGSPLALINALRSAGGQCSSVRVAGLALGGLDDVRFNARQQGQRSIRLSIRTTLSELADAYVPRGSEPQRPAGLASLRRPARLSADVDSGGIGRNAARGCDSPRGRAGER